MMKQVKVVEGLIGTARDGEMSAMFSQRSTITDMSNMKWLRHVIITEQGVVVERIGKAVLIPMVEILKLAEAAEPSLSCPAELQPKASQ